MATIIGLTGGISSGKSTVSNMLKEKGFYIVDADIAARVVVEPGEKAYEQVVKAFGAEILQTDSTINRQILGSIIFHDEDKRQTLNNIVHPAVRERMNQWKEEAIKDGKQTIIYDIPLLFESKLTYLVEKTVVVYVDESVQMERLMLRNNFSEQDAKARINSQMPLVQKVKLADEVINNNGSLANTRIQLHELIRKWSLVP